MNRLAKPVVHEICTNQVVVTLQACVKELVENSLDAKATRIEVRLGDSGAELLEVIDNGRGISAEDFDKVASRHATSKIRQYTDLSSGEFSSFGFRGEALSAISAMGDMTIATKTPESAASLLCYDRYGKLVSSSPIAREVGTTVSVRELFKRLPVRHKEFMKNAKSQVSATLRLIQSYAIAQPQVRFSVVAEKRSTAGGGRATLLCTSGTATDWHQAAAAVLGDAALAKTQKICVNAGGWQVEGLISSPMAGRRSRDAQLFFVNGRPIDPPKRVAKLINDTYHQYNSRAWPLVILAFTAPQGMVDVNVTPDKKTVFLHQEELLLAGLQPALTELFAAPELHIGCGSLGDFGIRPRNAVVSDDDGTAVPNTPEPAPVALNVDRETPEKSRALVGTGLISQSTEDSQSSTNLEDVQEMRVTEIFSDQAPAVHSPHREADTGGLEPPGVASSPPRQSVWSQPLKRRREGDLDLEIIELSMEEDVDMPDQRAERAEVAMLSNEEPGWTDGHLDATGLDLNIEEYVPPVEGSEMEVESVENTIIPAEDNQCSGSDLPAIGCSFTSSITLEGLRSGARRRREVLSAETSQATSEVSFPRAFSLTALRSGSEGASLEEVAKFASDETSGAPGLRFDKRCFSKMRVIGQFNLGFIIGALPVNSSSRGGKQQLFIVDQHASDEKFRFEALNRESRIERQPLVSAHPLQLTPAQEQLAEAYLEIFRKNGFDLQKDEARPPGRRLRVTALPSCQGMVFNEKDIHDLLYKLEEAQPSEGSQSLEGGLLDLDGHRALWSTALPRPQKVWTLLASKACRYACMVGKALRVSDMEKILRNLGTLRQPWNCPHGRPTMRHLVDTDAARKAPRRTLSVFKVGT